MPVEEERTRNKEGHIARDCKGTQSMKKWKIQEELDDEDNEKKK